MPEGLTLAVPERIRPCPAGCHDQSSASSSATYTPRTFVGSRSRAAIASSKSRWNWTMQNQPARWPCDCQPLS
jgi:hypothetical protein